MIGSIPVPRYTYSDYERWQEDWELIDGYPFQILSPVMRHCYTKGKLVNQIHTQLEEFENQNIRTFFSLDWIIGNHTVVRPDVMIVCGIFETDYLEFPPVLIIEIISQSSLQRDRNIKFDLYKENGVKYYLMLDYTKQTIETFQLIDNIYRSVDTNQFVLTDTCTISFDFTSIFKT